MKDLFTPKQSWKTGARRFLTENIASVRSSRMTGHDPRAVFQGSEAQTKFPPHLHKSTPRSGAGRAPGSAAPPGAMAASASRAHSSNDSDTTRATLVMLGFHPERMPRACATLAVYQRLPSLVATLLVWNNARDKWPGCDSVQFSEGAWTQTTDSSRQSKYAPRIHLSLIHI